MRIVIIEDELLVASRLEKLILSVDGDSQIVTKLYSVEETRIYFSKPRNVDLIMADIRLGDGLVFDALGSLSINSHIVFVTAYDEYAIKAFKYNGIDYILKPPTKEAIQFALNRSLELKNSAFLSETLKFMNNPLNINYRKRFICNFGGGSYRPIDVDEIALININCGIVKLYTFDSTSCVLEETMDKIESELDPKLFFRANRQNIINVNSIDKIVNLWNRKIQVKLKFNIPIEEPILISKEKMTRFKNWLNGIRNT
ncbi:MAG: LytTR family DNA-binding domain-containing protein [Muribaculaceae bacterium]|nr:LytTR family DNA-binding domain-containing protein [Muribaculaceae bacterium]